MLHTKECFFADKACKCGNAITQCVLEARAIKSRPDFDTLPQDVQIWTLDILNRYNEQVPEGFHAH